MSSQSFSQLITVNIQYNGIKITKQCSDVNYVKSIRIWAWSGPHFVIFWVNTGACSVNLHTQPRCLIYICIYILYIIYIINIQFSINCNWYNFLQQANHILCEKTQITKLKSRVIKFRCYYDNSRTNGCCKSKIYK